MPKMRGIVPLAALEGADTGDEGGSTTSQDARIRQRPGETRPGGFGVELLEMELDQTQATVVRWQVHGRAPLRSVCVVSVFRAPRPGRLAHTEHAPGLLSRHEEEFPSF